MARITTSSHPLVSLRVFCGFTRGDISRIAGISVSQIQNIELGRSPMPREASILIEAATGCLASSLVEKESLPLYLTGEKFTSKLWREWQNQVPTEKEIQLAEDDLVFRLRMMIRASGHGLYGFRWAVSRALDEAAKNAGISNEAIDAECRKKADCQKEEMPVREFENIMSMCGKTKTEIKDLLGKFDPLDGVVVWRERYQIVPRSDEDEIRKKKIADHKGEGGLLLVAHKKEVEIFRVTLPDGEKIELRSYPGKALAVGQGEKSGGMLKYNQA